MPAPRRKLNFWAGLLLIAGGIALLFFFVKDPQGSLPGFPQYWKGGPMLLGACFLSIYGALLLILRRFSLAAVLAGALASGLLTAGVHSYVYSIREVERKSIEFYLPAQHLEEFLRRSRSNLNSERLLAFALDASRAGYLKDGLDFDSATVMFGGVSGDENRQKMTIEFGHCPYVHPRKTGAQELAYLYGMLILEWKNCHAQSLVPNPSLALIPYSPGFSFDPLNQNHNLVIFLHWLSSAIERAIPSERRSHYYWGNFNMKSAGMNQILVWFHSREPDPELKEFLGEVLEELKKLP